MILPKVTLNDQAHPNFSFHPVLRASEAQNPLEEFKLCDFGMRFTLEGTRTNEPQTYAGKKAYKPPVRRLYQMLYSEYQLQYGSRKYLGRMKVTLNGPPNVISTL